MFCGFVPPMQRKRIWGTLDPFIEAGGYMGRSAANAGFLHALLDADPFDAYHFFLSGPGQATVLHEALAEQHPRLLADPGKIRLANRLELPAALGQVAYHCFHCSDCINHPAQLARIRNLMSKEIFPVTSVTHSLSYSRYAKEFLAHLWPGCTPRDVVVATSRAGKHAVEGFYEALRAGYGLAPEAFPQPQITTIPLGIDPLSFVPANAESKAAARQLWSFRPEQTVLLVFGRIDHASKLDVLPLLRALQRVQAAPGGLCLVLAGGSSPEAEADDVAGRLYAAARALGLDLRRVVNPDAATKQALFAAADIFVSPVDNLQETFGLVLLEAGAMGLPAIVSDFDGYRDIVEHERTGLLIPTRGPLSDAGFDACAPLEFDNQYHLKYAQQTVVDVPLLAAAIERLAAAPDERRRLGEAARRRVLELFTWAKVVDAYVALWDRLWGVSVDAERVRTVTHPLHIPYGRVFASYPSQSFDPALRLRWSGAGQAVYRGRDHYYLYAGVAAAVDPAAVKTLLFLARKVETAGRLVQRLATAHELLPETARFHLLWALKHDLLECVFQEA